MIISTPYFSSYSSLDIPCKSPLIIMAFCLFVYDNPLNTVSTVHKCVCGGHPLASRKPTRGYIFKKSNSLNPRNYQKLLNKYQKSEDHLPHPP